MSFFIAIAALIIAGVALAVAISVSYRVSAIEEDRIDQFVRDRDLF